MADNTLNNKKLNPDLRDILNDLKRDVFLNFNCHGVAEVKEVDLAKQTLVATLVYKKTNIVRAQSGEYVPRLQPYPDLIDVPFISLRGGSSGLSLPIKPGDSCVILFNDRSIDDWHSSGQVVPLSSNRLHSISDGIALVGISSMADLIQGYDPERAVLYNGETKVAVGDKIELSNTAENFADLMQELLGKLNTLTTQIAAITVSYVDSGSPSVSGTPVNAAAILSTGSDINQIATRLGGLLE